MINTSSSNTVAKQMFTVLHAYLQLMGGGRETEDYHLVVILPNIANAKRSLELHMEGHILPTHASGGPAEAPNEPAGKPQGCIQIQYIEVLSINVRWTEHQGKC